MRLSKLKIACLILAIAVVLLGVLFAGFVFYTKSYYPTLPIEGLSKRDALQLLNSKDGELILLQDSAEVSWYGYKGNQMNSAESMIALMKKREWSFVDQMGAGYFFTDAEGHSRIITSQMWTSRYVLYKLFE
jgi:hypothetical protein